MPSVVKVLATMRSTPGNVRFVDLLKVCEHYFGTGRQVGSHHVFKVPWPGDPRVNVQPGKGGKAKDYQVRQVVKAIEQLDQETEA